MLDFVSRLQPTLTNAGPCFWFIFFGDRLLIREEGGAPERVAPRRDAWARDVGPGSAAHVPLLDSPHALGLSPLRVIYLGHVEEGGTATDCYAAEVAAESAVPEGYLAEGLRALYTLLPEPFMAIAGRAVQLVAYDRQNQFCGQCGSLMADQENERAKRCPGCGLVVYPRLSPAMIIAVTRQTEDGLKILLARNHRFPPGRFSVLAGYVEPGESLEACCAREVCEEVGVDIRDIRYFGSQPWPFPNSLMIGFTAVYAGGDIRLEESELAEARWFAATELPGIPPPFTIARRLIDWFIQAAQAS
jgi:NAD+ diphosphatase